MDKTKSIEFRYLHRGKVACTWLSPGVDNTYYTNIETMLALSPSGSNYLTNGPGNRGLDFNNNSDYRNAGIGITRNNNYLSLFNGVFFAPSTGSYQWEIRGNDDRGTVWLDLDQDGIFETNGDYGSEQLVYQPPMLWY